MTETQDSDGQGPIALLRRHREWLLFALLAIAVIFGGGGVGAGFFNLTVQLAAIAILAFSLPALTAFLRDGPRGLVLLVFATILLPVVQLIPLPPAIWTQLPGRELVSEGLELVGAQDRWFPLSVDTNRTTVAILALLPPLAILVLSWKMDGAVARRAAMLVVALGLASVLLGALQLYSGNAVGNWFPGGRPDELYGTFANHNSTGLFLVIALTVLIGLPLGRRNPAASLAGRIAMGVILAVGVVLTQSRSSSTLLAAPGIFLLFRVWWGAKAIGSGREKLLLPILIGTAVVLGAGAMLVANQKVQQTVERFSDLSDARPEIWDDSWAGIKRYWPVGSGTGTFDEVFQVDESLEYLDRGRAGRAHNEYLEVALESGVTGLLLVGAWLAWFLRGCIGALRPSVSPGRIAAAAALACIVLQSVLDYPLRNQALLCIAALLAVLLARPRTSPSATGSGESVSATSRG